MEPSTAALIAAVTSGLTQMIKVTFNVADRAALLLTVLVAIVVTFWEAASNGTIVISAQSLATTGLAGLIIGLTVAGLYKVGDRLMNNAAKT